MDRWQGSLIIVTAALAAACARQPADNDAGPPAGVSEAGPADSPSVADRSGSFPDRAAPDRAAPDGAPPDAESLLPPLPGYRTDDDAEPGEVEASLDHGSVAYEQVRRRIVLDEQGFTSGAVTVVTFRPDSGTAEQILDHTYGEAPRSSIRLAGEEMMRIETDHFAAIAWVGPGFVVTFQRGQERTDEWLEDLIRATVRAVADDE